MPLGLESELGGADQDRVRGKTMTSESKGGKKCMAHSNPKCVLYCASLVAELPDVGLAE